MVFRDVDIKQLFELMKSFEIGEVSLSDGKTSIHVKRAGYAASPGISPAAANAFLTPPPPRETGSVPPEPQHRENPAPPVPQDPPPSPRANYYALKSPLVGAFYRAASPDAKPYVSVGDRVKSGDILCIVEAMKSMNEIQSDVSGVIREILLKNGDLAEFEQVLFLIDTNA